MSRARRIIERHDLESRLNSLKSEFAQAAQKVYDDWTPDASPDGDWEVGHGGICNLVADALADVVWKHLPDVECTTASYGDNHTACFVWLGDKGEEDAEMFAVDIPYHYYEISHGWYDWEKIPGVSFSPSDVQIDHLWRNDYPANGEEWFESLKKSKSRKLIERLEMSVTQTKVSVNPRKRQQAYDELGRNPGDELRILAHLPTEDIYFFDAWGKWHKAMAEELGLDWKDCAHWYVYDKPEFADVDNKEMAIRKDGVDVTQHPNYQECKDKVLRWWDRP
jgi:hypothetical protein